MIIQKFLGTRRVFIKTILAGTGGLSSSKAGYQADTSRISYFVDNIAGNDLNDGLTPRTAFQTIKRINSLQLTPGQVVGFKADGIWRENLLVSHSGNSTGTIIYQSYGVGAQPIISGANLAEWTPVSELDINEKATVYPRTIVPTIWRTAQSSNPLYVAYNSSPATEVNSFQSLTAAGQWYWDGISNLYVSSPENPSSIVEIPTRPYGVTLSSASFVTFSNLNFRGAQVSGLYASGGCNNVVVSGCTLELNWENGGYFIDGNNYQNNGVVVNCVLRNNGGSGWNTNGYFSQWLFSNNQAYLNGRILTGSIEHDFSAGIKMYSVSGKDGVGTVVENNISYLNGLNGNNGQGVGLWADTCHGIDFHRNTVHHNNAWGLFLEKNVNSKAYFNVCYNNAVVAYCANIACKASDSNNASNNSIFNNSCYGGWWGMYCGAYEGNGPSQISQQMWQNNIATGSLYQNFYVDLGADNDGVNGFNNIYSYNCFGVAAPNFLFWANRGLLSSYSDLDSCCGGASFSIEGDPMYTNVKTETFTLKPNSPCIGAGVQIPGFTKAHPNLGAF